ncbi:MAG: GIY-YIG nuclease family protein [Alphaproteobacteria bacterium]|nr:GIY-YIG nuclease family protein [Alphaproteobacteria bacterium]MBR5904534.1 GIY-YIG nuclease family protein [Alphaproteobacteria bacterium]
MKSYHEPYKYYVYIMASAKNGTLYTGITNDIARRSFEHKIHLNKKSFSARYNINKLVYVEVFENPEYAIMREKQIKSWNRKKKIELIESVNPQWIDMFYSLTS